MLKKINHKLVIAAAAAALLLVLNIVTFAKLERLSEKYDDAVEMLLSESASNRNKDDYLNNISSLLAHDLNTTRASLGLDTADYPFRDLTGEETESEENDEIDIMIHAVDALQKAEADNRKSAALGRFLNDDLIVDTFSSNKIVYRKINNLSFNLESGEAVFIEISAEGSNGINLKNLSGDELNINSASKEAALFINNSLAEYKEAEKKMTEMVSSLFELGNSREIHNITDEKIIVNNEKGRISITNTINSSGLTAEIDFNQLNPVFLLSGTDESFNNIDSLKTALHQAVQNMDYRTAEETVLDNARIELEANLSDNDFLDYIESLNLKLSTQPREDLDYYYYDLDYSEGNRLGSFSILKKLGDVYLVDSDEVPITSLKTLNIRSTMGRNNESSLIIPENIPQFDSLYSSSDTVTFLLVGNHERNTDTMILVHADRTTGKAWMIGIPRDLYWKGRKINSIYLTYGAEQFKKELSDITGLDISHYIIIDMYAFIDIVNILGGIEVTLDEDLIDPTYKIRENGKWSTLNYPKGTYNLNGIEALRVARSRHGSNDFERSERQQLIIESFLNRIRSLGFSDINKTYEMIHALFEYIDTDFSLVELMSLYNNYSDVKLAGKHVLSFDNILYDTYSNIYMLDDQDIEFGPDFNKGAWILFPRDNDWNNIRWYIRQIINGEL